MALPSPVQTVGGSVPCAPSPSQASILTHLNLENQTETTYQAASTAQYKESITAQAIQHLKSAGTLENATDTDTAEWPICSSINSGGFFWKMPLIQKASFKQFGPQVHMFNKAFIGVWVFSLGSFMTQVVPWPYFYTMNQKKMLIKI